MANKPYTYNLHYNWYQIDDRFDENNRLSINCNLSGMDYLIHLYQMVWVISLFIAALNH